MTADPDSRFDFHDLLSAYRHTVPDDAVAPDSGQFSGLAQVEEGLISGGLRKP